MNFSRHALSLVLAAAVAAALAACGDPAVTEKTDALSLPKDFAQGDAILSDVEAPIDAVTDAVAPADDLAPDVPATPDIAPELAPDVPPAVDAAPDVPPPLTCQDCDFTVQPLAPHPGGPGPLTISDPQTVSYGASYQQMLIVKPMTPGIFPVMLFVPGKQLGSNGMGGTLGTNYLDFLKHVASHGYIAALVQVEMNALDADHVRMGDDLLAAQKALPDVVTTADMSKIIYVGHSMGAKVVLLAAYKNINTDTKNAIQDPAAVMMFAISNEPPPVGTFQDAQVQAKGMWSGADTYFTFVQAKDDTIAPYLDATKANGLTLYNELKTDKKQIIVLHGTMAGDALNAPTVPALHADHSAPLTIEGKPGGLAGLAMPDSHLDALDWYGYWKLTVGALDFHFAKGDQKWAYGAMREHGGNLPGGGYIKHEVLGQGWK